MTVLGEFFRTTEVVPWRERRGMPRLYLEITGAGETPALPSPLGGESPDGTAGAT
jgi:hypothetical protein